MESNASILFDHSSLEHEMMYDMSDYEDYDVEHHLTSTQTTNNSLNQELPSLSPIPSLVNETVNETEVVSDVSVADVSDLVATAGSSIDIIDDTILSQEHRPNASANETSLEESSSATSSPEVTDNSNADNSTDRIDDELAKKLLDETTFTDTKTSCLSCDYPDTDAMMQCATCKQWIHYGCTLLPAYQLWAFKSTHRKYECSKCVDMPGDFTRSLLVQTTDCFTQTISSEMCDREMQAGLCDCTKREDLNRAVPNNLTAPPPDFTAPTPDLTTVQINLSQTIVQNFQKLENNMVECLRGFRSDLDSAANELLKVELNNKKRECNELQRDLASARKQIGELKSRTDTANATTCEGSCRLVSELSQQLDEKHAELMNTSEKLAVLTTEKEQALKNVEAISNELQLCKVALKKEEQNHAATLQKISDIDTQLLQRDDQLRATKAELSLKIDEVLALKSHLEAANCQDNGWTQFKKRHGNTTTSPETPLAESATGRPQSNDVRTTEPSQSDATKADPDLLIIGNSNVKNINAERIYHSRKTKVVELMNGQKNIDGAIAFSELCRLRPKVVIYQVAGNSLANNTAEACLAKLKNLVNTASNQFTDAKIYIAEPLPRKYSSPQQTAAYAQKVCTVKENLSSICIPPNVHPLKHDDKLQAVSSQFFTHDNIHLNQRGVGRLVLNYKLAVSADLGINYTPRSTTPTPTTSTEMNSNPVPVPRPQSEGNKPAANVTHNVTTTSPPSPSSAWSHPTHENQSTKTNNLIELVQDLKKQKYHFNELVNNLKNFVVNMETC